MPYEWHFSYICSRKRIVKFDKYENSKNVLKYNGGIIFREYDK